jgi:hypothetical protein
MDKPHLRLGRHTKFVLSHTCSDLNAGERAYMWHHFQCTFTSSALNAHVSFDTIVDSFVSFRDDLARVSRELRGNAQLTTLESDLRLEASIDKLGHIRWSGMLRHPGPVPEETLEFWIEDDQTSLSRIIAELDAIIADAQNDEYTLR